MVRRVLLTLAAGLELVLVGNLSLVFVYGLVSAPYHGPASGQPLTAYAGLALTVATAAVLLPSLTLGARPAPRHTILARAQMAGLAGLAAVNLAILGWFGYGMVATVATAASPDSAFAMLPFLLALAVVALVLTEVPAQRAGSAAHR